MMVKWKDSISIAIVCYLAWVWSTPVMKPCGKNIPGSQYEVGLPSFNHLSIVATLSIKSGYQRERGFRDG